ncbi:MAG: PDZ domain-containing protein [Gemmatimonadota bacterium]
MSLRSTLAFILVPTALALIPGPALAQISLEPTGEHRGELGLSWRSEAPYTRGADGLRPVNPPVVSAVVPCSPAHLAGLEPGDVLLRINGRDARDGTPFPEAAPGTRYTIAFRRGETVREVSLTIGPARPDALAPVEERPLGAPADWGCGESEST